MLKYNMTYIFILLKKSILFQEEMNNLPPAYDSISPDDNLMVGEIYLFFC